MTASLPDIYWYVFFAVAIVLTIGIFAYLGTLEHRRRMRALDILKMYAEQGEEPPALISERLSEQILDPEKSPSLDEKRRGALMRGFSGQVYAGCATAGIAWWILADNGPLWAFIIMSCGTAFFAINALGMLLGALATYAHGAR